MDPEKSTAERRKNEQIERERFLKQSVENLEFSVRTFRRLKHADIKTVQELIHHSEKDLRENKNFGLKSVNEIKEFLGEKGLSLAVELEEVEFINRNVDDLDNFILEADDDF